MLASSLAASLLIAFPPLVPKGSLSCEQEVVPQDPPAQEAPAEPLPTPFAIQVRDYATEEAIPGAHVRLEEVVGITALAGRTNEAGKIRVSRYPSGSSVRLVVSHPDYAARVVTHVVARTEEYLRVYLIQAATLDAEISTQIVRSEASRVLRLEAVPGTDASLLLAGESYSTSL